MGDDFIFFGTKSEYQDLKKKEKVKESTSSDKKDARKEQNNIPALNVSSSDTSKIDDDTLRMLRRTRHPHDTRTVYMQSDTSFYDVFYTHSDEVVDDPKLLEEARAIRRIYKTYPEYLYALQVRDEYMEKLEEKSGNPILFKELLKSGCVQSWIPPIPIYSKKAVDYDDGKDGVINTDVLFEWDDDLLDALLDELRRARGISEDASNVEIVGEVITDNLTIYHSDLIGDDRQRGNESTSVNLSDLNELQKIFRAWYQDDTAKESKDAAVDDSLIKRAFSRTPERLKQAYYMSLIPDLSKEFHNAVHGIPNEEKYDPNEMVYDDELGKPMSRKEYDARSYIRFLKQYGWTDTLKLMKLYNVGSSREYSIMQKKRSAKKKRMNKLARSYEFSSEDTGIYGDTNIGNNMLFSDLDSLKAQMFPD